MALTERLQLLIESLGGSKVVGDFKTIGATGKAEFDKVGTAGNKAATDVATAQARMASASQAAQAKIAAATQRQEAAQLKAAHAAAAVERAQAKVAGTASGTLAAARANEALEAAQLRSSHAATTAAAAQARVAEVTVAANRAIAASRAELAATEAATVRLSGATGLAEGALTRLGVSGVGAGTIMRAGVAAGVGVAALAGLGAAKSFASLAEEVDSIQDVMGGTAKEASKLRFAAVALGVPIDTVAAGVFKLSSSLAKNKEVLAAYGVEAVRGRDGNVDLYATLARLSDAYRALEDPVARNRLLLAAFGRGGRDLEEIMSAGGGRLREFAKDAERLGVVLDNAGVKKGKEFGIQMRELGQALEGLAATAGGPVVSGLTLVATGLRSIFELAGRAVGAVNRVFYPSAGNDGQRAAKAATASAEETLAMTDRAARARERLVDIHIADLSRVSATASAAENLAEAEGRLAEVQISAAEDAAKAREDYAERVTAATERVADAETRLAEAQEAASARIVEAQRSAAEANLSAHESTRDAERALSDLRKDQAAAGNPALAAQLNRAQAIQRAVAAVDRAREREATTAEKGAESVAKAQEDGAKSVEAAEKQVTAARAEQVKVAAQAVEVDKKILAGQKEIESAVRAVSRAQADLEQSKRDDAIAEARERAELIILNKEAEGIEVDRVERNRILAGQFDEQADKLAEGSPLRKNLRDWADELRNIKLGIDTTGAQKSLDDLRVAVAKLGPLSPEEAAKVRTMVTGSQSPTPTGTTTTGTIPGRSGGGPVAAGQAYTVGEQRPETLVMFPGGGGYVYPNTEGRAAGGPVGPSAQFVAGMSGIDYDRLAAAIARAMSANPMGEPTIGPFVFHGVAPGDLPSQLPREMRKQRYLAGYGGR